MRGSNFQAHRRMLFASPSAAHTTRISGCPDRQSWVRACLQLPHEPQLLWDRAPQTHLRVSALATPAARVQEAEPQRTIATGGGAFGRRNSLKPSGRPPLLRGLPQQPKPVPQLSRLTGPWRRHPLGPDPSTAANAKEPASASATILAANPIYRRSYSGPAEFSFPYGGEFCLPAVPLWPRSTRQTARRTATATLNKLRGVMDSPWASRQEPAHNPPQAPEGPCRGCRARPAVRLGPRTAGSLCAVGRQKVDLQPQGATSR